MISKHKSIYLWMFSHIMSMCVKNGLVMNIIFFTFSRNVLNFPVFKINTSLTSCSLNKLYVAIKPIGLVSPSSKIITYEIILKLNFLFI